MARLNIFSHPRIFAATTNIVLARVALSALLLIAARPAQAQTEGVIYNFDSDSVPVHPGIRPTGRSHARASGLAPTAPLFLPAVTYKTGAYDSIFHDNPAWVSVQDINGDGKPDILVANWCSGYYTNGACQDGASSNVGVLLGNGDGTFKPAVTYSSGGLYAFSVLTADVNGDGNLDLLVLNGCPGPDSNQAVTCPSSGSVGVLLGNGDGTFQAVKNYSSGGSATWMAVADVNGDGKPDVVFSSQLFEESGESTVGVLINNGDGTFQPVRSYGSGGLQSVFIVIADVNADGKPDLLVSNVSACQNCEGNVGVLLGNGDGTFQSVVTYPVFTANVLQVADLRNNGKLDLVVNGGGSFNGGVFSVLLSEGDGTFQPAVVYSAGGDYNGPPIVMDLNGDHKLDIAVPNLQSCANMLGNEGCVGVFGGNGDGTFQPAVQYAVGLAGMLTAGDVNGDGIVDLLTADGCAAGGFCDHGEVDVLLGNGDGTFQQATSYDSGGARTTWVGAADLTGDGKLDVIAVSPEIGSTEGLVGVLINISNSSGLPATSTTLVSSLNPSTYGQTVTFTASVSSTAGTPTGTVIFYDGVTSVGSATLVSETASLSISSLAARAHSITAAYQGSATFRGSTSAPLIQTVTTATTTTALTSSLNPAGTGQSIILTATVTSQYGGAATGSVTFYSGTQTLGTASLSGNRATLSTSFASAGTYSLSAKYSGDSNNTGSTSSTLSQVILVSTTTTLVSSRNPSLVGQAVTFTATVASTGGVPPNGELVTFKNGSSVLGTGALSGGSAALTTSSLPAGTDTITATYAGDANFSGSTSSDLRQVVNNTTKSATSTTLASNLNPSLYGQSITFKAAVTTSGSIAPTGTVNFAWDGYSIGTATLNPSGIATLTKSNLNVYTYPLTAVYSGDANNLGSTSVVLNQVVKQTTSSAKLTSSPNPSTQGQAVTFSVTISSTTVLPTGPVTFTAGTTALGTAPLSGGKATFATSTLAVGSTTVKASYSGDSNIAGSSASVTQVVQP